MSMWLVHWNMPNYCLSICHEWVCEWMPHWIGWMIKRYCLMWDGRPVCSPGSWSGRGWLPLNKGMTQYAKWPKWNNCEVTLDNQCYSLILNALYKCAIWIWIWIYFDSLLRCSSSIVTNLLSSVVMQSVINVHDSMAFTFMLIPNISSFMVASW